MRRFDYFGLVNAALFCAFTLSVSARRFSDIRGGANLAEFFVYACITGAVIGVAWWKLRGFTWSVPLLVFGQVVIVLDFAAGLVRVGDGRLYDLVVLAIRFDKLVHFSNAFFLAFLFWAMLDALGARHGSVTGLLVVLVVMGLGAVWEVAEYVVVLTMPTAGVGSYDNNMQDLAAGLCGAVLACALPERARAVFRGSRPGPASWLAALAHGVAGGEAER